jgi:hypothetical protein
MQYAVEIPYSLMYIPNVINKVSGIQKLSVSRTTNTRRHTEGTEITSPFSFFKIRETR